LAVVADAIFSVEDYFTMVIQDRASAGLKALTDEYTQRFAPVSLEEKFMVETLATCEFRSRHYMRTEAAIWDHASDAFTGNAIKDLDGLHRLIDSTQRTFIATLKQLMAAQSKRAPKPPSSGLFVVPKPPRA
jgi:hypothetical protein